MSIEPTEEQKQAAQAFCSEHMLACDNDVARLLAEREAKLTTSIMEMWVAERTQLNERYDTLRARVAELEAKQARLKHLANDEVTACGVHIDSLEKLLAASSEREAQHLADIKAAKDALEQARPSVEAWVTSDAEDVDSDAQALEVIDEVLARLAHYDDAKADAGAVCTHSARVWNVIDQTMRCRVCDDAKDAEGGEG